MADATLARRPGKIIVIDTTTTGAALFESLRSTLDGPLSKVGLQIRPDFDVVETAIAHPVFTQAINGLQSLHVEIVGLNPNLSMANMDLVAEMVISVIEGKQTLTGLHARIGELGISENHSFFGSIPETFEYDWDRGSTDVLSAAIRLLRDRQEGQDAASSVIAAHMAAKIRSGKIDVAVLNEGYIMQVTALLPEFEFEHVGTNGSVN